MTDVRWDRLKELVNDALQLPAAERARFLDDACADDPTLRSEVDELLGVDVGIGDSFLNSSPIEGVLDVGLREGEVVAERYRLIRKLGEGGMGQVWLAEQTAPVRRSVALKLIKAGMYDESVVQRFRSERQSLAIMDHPCIAKVFDAGATPQGQPFFVMEYVPGVPITEYCDTHKLSIQERLALFIQACEGVQHAHQKAIIHRDLKPANILVIEVDGKPVPRIIDFGLAKQIRLEAERPDETMLTRFGQFMCTPGYICPEQVDPDIHDVDTRTDLYSLGVILYVLLTGLQPFENQRRQRLPLDQWVRTLREEDPPAPGGKIAAFREHAVAAAAARDTTPVALSKMLRGDLDCITLKALDRDRERRYASPQELVADLKRHLNDEPISARPASTGYQLRKFVRRHRIAAAVGIVGAMLLIVASGAGLVAVRQKQYALIQRAAAQRQTVRAEQEARTAKETTRFMVDLFKISDPGEARGNSVTAREMLDKGAARVDQELAAQPAIQATLMDTLGTVYVGLGLYRQARPLLDRAVEERRRLEGDDPLALPNSLEHRGDVEYRQAEFASAEKDYLEAIRMYSLRPADRDSRIALANALHGLGFLLANEGRYAEAQRDLREALSRQTALYGEVHPDIARTLKDLARALADAGDLKQAIPIMQSAVAMQRRLRGSQPHPDVAEGINDLALLQQQNGDFAAAAAGYVEALALKRRLYGERHPEIASGLENLASALQDKGDLAGAESNYRLALAMNRELLGNEHPNVARTLHNLASLQYDRGETEEALATEGESLAIYRKVYPEGHRRLAFGLNTLGFWLTLAGRYTDAERHVHEALDMRRRLLGDKHPDVASSLVTLAHLDVAEKKYSDALAAAQSAAQIYTAAFSATHWRTAAAERAEGAALSGLGRYGEAEPLLARSNEILSKADAPQIVRQLSERYLDQLHRHARTARAIATQ